MSLFGQKSTAFNANLTLRERPDAPETITRMFVGTGNVPPLGNVALTAELTQPMDSTGNPTGPGKLVVRVARNRLDQFTLSADNVNVDGSAFASGTVGAGTGAYKGASGAASLSIFQAGTISPNNPSVPYALNGSATVTVGSQTTQISMNSFTVRQTLLKLTSLLLLNGTGTSAQLGNMTVDVAREADNSPFQVLNLTVAFNSADRIRLYATFLTANPPANLSGRIVGGTGIYEGASGSVTINVTPGIDSSYAVSVSGTVIQPPAPPAGAPVIQSVTTAAGSGPIAANAWLEIKGLNLVPKTTAAGGVFWSNATEFASGKMPTKLGNIGVTVSGSPAYIYWFCSATTTQACATDQINVLTALNSSTGPVTVVVTNNGVSGLPFYVSKAPSAPSPLLYDPQGYMVATHADYSIIGPTSLFPGYSTPARAGEPIVLWTVGFGLPSVALTEGSSSQSGKPGPITTCYMGNFSFNVTNTLVSPGLYQLNFNIPNAAIPGDYPFECLFNGNLTPLGNLITVGP